MATEAVRFERFWVRLAIGLALFIVAAFLQFTLRGFADPMTAPLWVHLHAVAMIGWLGLLIIQPMLAAQNNMSLHRLLGWTGGGLAALIVALGIFVAFASLSMSRFAPFFTPSYFLALTVVESLAFGGMVWSAIRRRRSTDWHRRLMMGATIIILEPALGRLLPLPLMIGWSDIPVGIIQLVVVGIIALYDRRMFGEVHRATRTVAAVVVAVRAAVYLLSMTPPVIAFADWITGR